MKSLLLYFSLDVLLVLLPHEAIVNPMFLNVEMPSFVFTFFILGVSLLALVILMFLRNGLKNKRLNYLLIEKNREIEQQRAILEIKNQELTIKNTIVENLNEDIRAKNKQLESQNQKIMHQRDVLLKQNKNIALTKQKLEQAIEELKRANSDLDKKVQQRTWKIKRTNEKLTKANKELDSMVYSTWHDFRSPITSLLGLLELARLDVKDSQAHTYFAQMLYILKKTDRILSKIRMLSVISRKSSVYFFENVNINEVLEEVKTNLEELLQTTKVRLEIENNVQKPFPCDFDALSFLLENLIENSIIFRNKLPEKEPFVKVNISVELDKNLVIRVEDNGIGISERAQSSIFNLLFRGSEQSEGSGMGLYIVQIAVEKMHGSISVESKEGVGSIFTCKLPIRTIATLEN